METFMLARLSRNFNIFASRPNAQLIRSGFATRSSDDTEYCYEIYDNTQRLLETSAWDSSIDVIIHELELRPEATQINSKIFSRKPGCDNSKNLYMLREDFYSPFEFGVALDNKKTNSYTWLGTLAKTIRVLSKFTSTAQLNAKIITKIEGLDNNGHDVYMGYDDFKYLLETPQAKSTKRLNNFQKLCSKYSVVINEYIRVRAKELEAHGLKIEDLNLLRECNSQSERIDCDDRICGYHMLALKHLVTKNKLSPQQAILEMLELNDYELRILRTHYGSGVRGEHLRGLTPPIADEDQMADIIVKILSGSNSYVGVHQTMAEVNHGVVCKR